MDISIQKLFACLLQDLCVDQYTRAYLLRRLDAEGVRFLTSTLPAFWKHILVSIENGRLDYRLNTSFSRKGNLPRIFHGFFRRIFDPQGFLLPNPCPSSLAAIRQVCEYCYKCSFKFSDRDLVAAEEKYVSTENDLARASIDWAFVEKCRKSFETYYPQVSRAHVEEILQFRPRFGPGSFVPPEEIQAARDLPPGEFKVTSVTLTGTHRADLDALSGYFKSYPSSSERLFPISEGKISEVAFVPKDGRGPRTISKEPVFMLKAQLGFHDWITNTLEHVTRKRVQFIDQTKNRQLALEGSRLGNWATFDLKDASDRVSYSVVSRIARFSPGIRYFVNKVRSTHTRLPSGKVLRLSKLSGMGSGLTFPLMALLIHLAVSTYVAGTLRLDYRSVSSQVYVYGDDLIVPTDFAPYVSDALTKVGLKINQDKSFVKGPFRESCGGDFLNGVEVSPVRFKCNWLKMPTLREVTLSKNVLSLSGPHACVSIERHCRELFSKALYSTADYLYSLLEETLGHKLPYIYGNVPYLGRQTLIEREVLMQQPQAVYSPVAVKRQAKEPDPYRYLGSKFRSQSEIPSWANNPLYLEKSQQAKFGEWAERYTVSLALKRKIPAFLLTEGRSAKSLLSIFGLTE